MVSPPRDQPTSWQWGLPASLQVMDNLLAGQILSMVETEAFPEPGTAETAHPGVRQGS